MQDSLRIFGIALIILGALLIAAALVLVNQQFQIVNVPWGVFDIQANGIPFSNSTVEAACGAAGIALFLSGVTLYGKS